jgi:uncharacterized radical SAM protein YgiQ
MMKYDIIFITGEIFFDHPLNGIAILKKVLEDKGYKIGIIETPKTELDITELGKPNLFFAISSGSIDSMVRNYTPLKKKRSEDKNLNYIQEVPDRALIVFSNWIRHQYKDSIIVLGGIEASLRRFVHYDYWDNKLRKPILFDTRADIMTYGCSEKQIIEIAEKIKNNQSLKKIKGTCIISKDLDLDLDRIEENIKLPSWDEVSESKEKYCDMQNLFSVEKNLYQKIDNRYIIQYNYPNYSSNDLDYYYSFPYSRKMPKNLRGFEFSVVSHRGCIGECNFCSLKLTQGNKIISRSEESILEEIKNITKLPNFKGNIDDLGGPSANMYGMDCNKCNDKSKSCIECKNLNRTNKRLVNLLKKALEIKGIKNIYIRSGIRFDLCSKEYLKLLCSKHIYDTLKIAPEHINKNVLKLMNKDKGELKDFIKDFKKYLCGKEISFYFMTAHPGSSIKEAKELADYIKTLKNCETVQIFTPTPMTISTCMYYTGLNTKNKEKIYIPYTYNEKKEQKRLIFSENNEKIIEYNFNKEIKKTNYK